jgi:6-pyruvoyl-tetrahydropterin synthase
MVASFKPFSTPAVFADDSMAEFWNIDPEVVLHPPVDYGYYKIVMSAFFNASHQIRLNGHAGALHHHSFHLRVTARAENLADQQLMLVPYEHLRQIVDRVVQAYDGTILNTLKPFRRLQPTTEILVGVIAQQMVRLGRGLPITVIEVALMESPTQGISVCLVES